MLRSSISLLVATGLLTSVVTGLGACRSADPDAASASAQVVASNVNVLTSRNDSNRTGLNPSEKILKTSNVKAGTFGKVFARPVDGQVYAQPLYVGGVNGKNVVYVATEHNTIYAFDADDASPNAQPLWSKNLGTPVPAADTQCGLLQPEIGITSTPVIDPDAKTIWFTTRNKENGAYLHKLHALDIATGEPRPNSPIVITAKANGTGDANVNGVITFDGLKQHQRPGLLKVKNKIYLGFASNCDIAPYHGWLLGYDANTLAQTNVHITTPNGGHGGIWNGGVGLAANEGGDIFYTAGDVYDQSNQADFNGAGNTGNSIVRLHDTGSDFTMMTKFTPFDTRTWSPRDLSLGNGGGILIPGTNLFVASDKRGVTFLVDRDNMGGEADQDAQIVQKFQSTQKGAVGGGAFLPQGTGGVYYLWGLGDRLRAYKFDGQKFLTPSAVNADTLTGYPGGSLSLSSDGQSAGTAILWAIKGKRTSPSLAASTGAGALVAFDASDITKQLWSSDDAPADLLGNATKFNPPTIANGKVYIGTSSNQLVVYGLTDGANHGPDTTADAGPSPVDAGSDAPPSGDAPTWTTLYNTVFGPNNTPGHCSSGGGCHTQARGGFKCGTTKDDCFAGLAAANLIDTTNPANSVLIDPQLSPVAWFNPDALMPFDDPSPKPEAAAAVKAWVLAGAKNN